jgi:hypothetical protein
VDLISVIHSTPVLDAMHPSTKWSFTWYYTCSLFFSTFIRNHPDILICTFGSSHTFNKTAFRIIYLMLLNLHKIIQNEVIIAHEDSNHKSVIKKYPAVHFVVINMQMIVANVLYLWVTILCVTMNEKIQQVKNVLTKTENRLCTCAAMSII